MSRLAAWLANGPLITDGAWGTQLQTLGLPLGVVPDTWNLEHPEHVESVARAYVEAGSQVILTNTFRANRITLADSGLADLVEPLNRAGVSISRRAAGSKALVFASMGPTGKMLLTDDLDPALVTSAFAEQARVLAANGADALLLETFSDLEEAKLALAGARQAGLPVVVSFAFDSGKNLDRTMMGSTPEVIAREIESAGADVVGANCGAGIERFAPVCQRLKAACSLPIWIKANAGLPEVKAGAVVYTTSAAFFAGHYSALIAAGASFLGGCCGTNPDFIRALVATRSTPCASN